MPWRSATRRSLALRELGLEGLIRPSPTASKSARQLRPTWRQLPTTLLARRGSSAGREPRGPSQRPPPRGPSIRARKKRLGCRSETGHALQKPTARRLVVALLLQGHVPIVLVFAPYTWLPREADSVFSPACCLERQIRGKRGSFTSRISAPATLHKLKKVVLVHRRAGRRGHLFLFLLAWSEGKTRCSENQDYQGGNAC